MEDFKNYLEEAVNLYDDLIANHRYTNPDEKKEYETKRFTYRQALNKFNELEGNEKVVEVSRGTYWSPREGSSKRPVIYFNAPEGKRTEYLIEYESTAVDLFNQLLNWDLEGYKLKVK